MKRQCRDVTSWVVLGFSATGLAVIAIFAHTPGGGEQLWTSLDETAIRGGVTCYVLNTNDCPDYGYKNCFEKGKCDSTSHQCDTSKADKNAASVYHTYATSETGALNYDTSKTIDCEYTESCYSTCEFTEDWACKTIEGSAYTHDPREDDSVSGFPCPPES